MRTLFRTLLCTALYWARIFRSATTATFSNARTKLVRGVFVGMIAILLQWYLFSIRTWTETQKIAVCLVGAAIIVIIVEFCWQFVSAPVRLDQRVRFHARTVRESG